MRRWVRAPRAPTTGLPPNGERRAGSIPWTTTATLPAPPAPPGHSGTADESGRRAPSTSHPGGRRRRPDHTETDDVRHPQGPRLLLPVHRVEVRPPRRRVARGPARV